MSKGIANRLKHTIGEVISESQNGFIKDRYIFDGILTANECAQWLKQKKKKGTLLKLDFSKVYDSIRWSFLDHMLTQVGFGLRMKNGLLWCVKTTSVSSLSNGCPTNPFKMEKGIR